MTSLTIAKPLILVNDLSRAYPTKVCYVWQCESDLFLLPAFSIYKQYVVILPEVIGITFLSWTTCLLPWPTDDKHIIYNNKHHKTVWHTNPKPDRLISLEAYQPVILMILTACCRWMRECDKSWWRKNCGLCEAQNLGVGVQDEANFVLCRFEAPKCTKYPLSLISSGLSQACSKNKINTTIAPGFRIKIQKRVLLPTRQNTILYSCISTNPASSSSTSSKSNNSNFYMLFIMSHMSCQQTKYQNQLQLSLDCGILWVKPIR